jgi:uncharacterized protein YndB with AHSA1/START domain
VDESLTDPAGREAGSVEPLRPEPSRLDAPMSTVRWRIHLRAAPPIVFDAIATAEGRRRWWVESANAVEGRVEFVFPDGTVHRGRVLEQSAPTRFAVEYYGGTIASFALEPDGAGGTDLTLVDEGVAVEWLAETSAGWVSVLMALKAAVDHGVDLRNHDPVRTWREGFADN